ncbi:MAG: hypothetical protein CME61_06045 [Halobacteriovoraceae bacterium]|nr:hypothetical protein [Halobacteriovoraceae bacterium]
MYKYDVPENRCPKCYSMLVSCFCDQLTKVNSELSWSLIMYKKEYLLSSNTGRLALNTLPNCQLYLRGLPNKKIPWEHIFNSKKKFYFLFPSEDAIEPSQIEHKPRDIHFIVPDGSWNQAKKVLKREPALRNIQCVKLPDRKYISNYHCRKQPRENFLCTYESMGIVIKELEGDKEKSNLDKNLNVLTYTSLKNRRHFSPSKLKSLLWEK